MIASCSAWIVATMSRIWPVRARPSSASSGSGTPPEPASESGIVEVLVEDVLELGAGEHEPPAQAEAEGVGERGPVERRGDGGPPVDDHRRAVAVLDVAAADVPAVAGLLVDPAEAQRAGLVVEGREPLLRVATSPPRRPASFAASTSSSAIRDAVRRRIASRHCSREPQTGALGRHVRVGHDEKDSTTPADNCAAPCECRNVRRSDSAPCSGRSDRSALLHAV